MARERACGGQHGIRGGRDRGRPARDGQGSPHLGVTAEDGRRHAGDADVRLPVLGEPAGPGLAKVALERARRRDRPREAWQAGVDPGLHDCGR